MKHLGHFALVLSLALIGACGSDSDDNATNAAAAPSTQTGSCNRVNELSACTDLAGEAFALGESMQRSLCEAGNGTFGSAACPTAGLVGSCDISGGQTRRYYSSGALAYTAETAQSDCTQLYGGTWQAAP